MVQLWETLKQNRVLLAFLVVSAVVVVAIILPDYLACDAPHIWPKSQSEISAETAERRFLRTYLDLIGGASADLHIDGGWLMVRMHRAMPSGLAEDYWLYGLPDEWRALYAWNHPGANVDSDACLRIVLRDERNAIVYSGMTRYGMYMLWTNRFFF